MDLKGAELRSFYVVSQCINDRSGQNHGVKIPHYQRPYRWDRENVKKLIEDWSDHKKKTDYFSGSIVTVASDNKEHDLIDGQQRFTTLFLTNFVQFLVLRELVSVSLREEKYFPEFKTLYRELIQATQYLFNDQNLDNLEQLGSEIYDERQEQNYEAATKKFNCNFFLSSSDVSDHDERVELLYEKLKSSTLFLTYDRITFNDSLAKVLSHAIYSLDDINLPKFYISKLEQDIFNENEVTYLNAIIQIVESFQNIVESEGYRTKTVTSYIKATNLKDRIKDFLEEVKLCLIQTGNTDDAYTLFEVLNDRALALDDLDLIKNLFYKNFVIKNPEINESRKDRVLQNLDQQWIERIYQAGVSDAEKKLVTYLAVVFITGSTQITHKATKDYRVVLNKYFDKEEYSEQEIKRDFNIFEACKIFVRVFRVKFRSQDIIAVQAEYNKTASISSKLVFLLMALKQEGVLSGFVNYLLNYIQNTNSEFEPNKVKEIFENLTHTESADDDIEAQAKTIWTTSILSKDSAFPRQLATNLISTNNLKNNTLRECTLIKKQNSITPQDEFQKWIEDWKFGANLKVRILFARLFKLSLEDGVLVNKFFSFGLTESQVKELELDHMEAKNPTQEFLKYYFQDDLREYYINGIGNIMPLPKTENIKKSNLPLIHSMDFYKEVGLDKHFIMVETRLLLDLHSNENGIPTTQFFIQRKQKLIEWFKQCIEL